MPADICAQYTDNKINSEQPSIPYDTGLLWKIEKNGTVNHLFGTMHSQDRQVTTLPPQVLLALVQSKKLIMEVVPDEKANQQFLEAIYFSDSEESLPGLLPEQIYTRLEKLFAYYEFTTLKLSRLKPWAAFTLIGRPKPVKAATQDQVLFQLAFRYQKKIYGLESMEELTQTLNSISIEDQSIILIDTVCNHEQILNDAWELVQMYTKRDLAGIYALTVNYSDNDAVLDRYLATMLYGRNKQMLSRMQIYLDEGNAFIAVGASHLAGEHGLLQVLAQKGYTITSVY